MGCLHLNCFPLETVFGSNSAGFMGGLELAADEYTVLVNYFYCEVWKGGTGILEAIRGIGFYCCLARTSIYM